MQYQKNAVVIYRPHALVSLACAAGVAITLAPLANAEVEQELDALVISALRMPTDAGKVTASVTVLDPKDLRDRGVNELATALNESPGVISISAAGQTGAAGSLFIRGTTTNYSQIMVDGIRLSDASANIGAVLGAARIDDVDRIEVLRGAQSAFYGGEAVGGVIWMETARGAGAPSGRSTVEAGSYGTGSASTSYQGSKGPFSWFFSGGAETTQNDAARNDYQQEHVALRLEQAVGDHLRLGMTFRGMDSLLHIAGTAEDKDLTRTGLVTTYLEGDLRPWWHTRTVAGFYDESYDHDGAYPFDSRIQRSSISTDHSFDITEHHRLLAGAFFDHTEYHDNGGTKGVEVSRDRAGAHVGWEWTPTDRITTNAALRFEDQSSFGQHVTWRTGASWRIPVTETRLVAGVGRAFRAPTFSDLYYQYHSLFWNYDGNPNLRAESSLGWDLGVEQPLGKNTVAAVTFFRNNIKDRIDPGFTSPFNSPGTSVTDGVETSLHGSWDEGRWAGRLAWTWLGKSLRDQPDNVLTASLDWKPVEKLTLGSGVNYVSARSWGGTRLDDYLLVRFYGRYKLTESVSLTARVENALNRNYQLSNFYGDVVQGPGTGVYGGVTVEW